MIRLESLMLANNKIARVEPNFAEMCPKLTDLILSFNRIAKFSEIDQIGESCTGLQRLSLIGNQVENLPNYRAYVIYKCPSLKVLDF